MSSFFLGILAAIGSLALELVIFSFSSTNYTELIQVESIKFLIIAAVIEEIFKLAIIWREAIKLDSINQIKKIIPQSIFIGIGFSFSEFFIKQLNYKEIPIIPFLGVFFVHIITSLIAGYFLYKNNQKARKVILAPIFILNLIIHIAYNIAVFYYF